MKPHPLPTDLHRAHCSANFRHSSSVWCRQHRLTLDSVGKFLLSISSCNSLGSSSCFSLFPIAATCQTKHWWCPKENKYTLHPYYYHIDVNPSRLNKFLFSENITSPLPPSPPPKKMLFLHVSHFDQSLWFTPCLPLEKLKINTELGRMFSLPSSIPAKSLSTIITSTPSTHPTNQPYGIVSKHQSIKL